MKPSLGMGGMYFAGCLNLSGERGNLRLVRVGIRDWLEDVKDLHRKD